MTATASTLPAYTKGKRAYYETLYAQLRNDRSSFDTLWGEIADYLVPHRTRFFAGQRNKGDRRNRKIINSAGTYAAGILESGMHTGLTSPSRPWFRLSTPDPDLALFPAVKAWLHTVTQRMATLFETTNLYNALPTVYGDMGAFGTAALAVLEDSEDYLRAYTFPVGSYYVGLDARGLATTFARESEMSVRQLVEMFGGEDGQPISPGDAIDWSRFSRAVQDAWNNANYEAPVRVLWVVCPNREYRTDKLGAKYYRWSSCHIELAAEKANAGDAEKILRESGFKNFPTFVPRWKVTGEDAYGTSAPGITALGDVKQLQSMERKKGIAIEKGVDPSLVGPTALKTQTISLLPGAVTYADTREGMAGLRAIHDVTLNLEHLVGDMDRVEGRIARAFHADLFQMMAQLDAQTSAGREITAREIEERHEEKLMVLGPVVERTNDDLLNPLIDRAFAIMIAAGMVPPAPQELQGIRLKVEYISFLAQAQKLAAVSAQDRFVTTVGAMLETFPEVRRKLRAFQIVDNYADMLGVDPLVVVPNDEAQQAVDNDARMQQAAQLAATAKDGAAAAKAASETDVTGDNALTRATEAIGASQ